MKFEVSKKTINSVESILLHIDLLRKKPNYKAQIYTDEEIIIYYRMLRGKFQSAVISADKSRTL